MQDNNLQMRAKRKTKRRVENGILFGSILLCLITLGAITVCLIMVFKYRASQLENEAVMQELEVMEEMYTKEQVDVLLAEKGQESALEASQQTREEILARMKEAMLSGEGAVKMLRQFYPDEIVMVDNNQYYFIPILDTVAHHDYKPENFVHTVDDLIEYYEDGKRISHKGIDVSKYQERIDWEKVAQDEVEYAFVRLGIRGYTEGEIMEDDTFTYNIRHALENDIAVGVYFFTQATSIEEAQEEAQFVLDALEPYDVTYPVVLDVEAVTGTNARAGDLTREERTQYCIAFCDMIRQAGYTPMIYGNLKTFMLMLDYEKLEEYDKWFAHYDEEAYFPYEFKIWQYTDSGSVAGIKGDVDMNISFEDYANGR